MRSTYLYLLVSLIFFNTLSAEPIKLEFINAVEVPTNEENMFVGVSGLAYEKETGTLFAVSDESGYPDRPYYIPGLESLLLRSYSSFYKNEPARFFSLKVDFDKNEKQFKLTDLIRKDLREASGEISPRFTYDFEAMTLMPNGNLLVSSERFTPKLHDYVLCVNPTFVEMSADGTRIKNYDTPEAYYSYPWKFWEKKGPKVNGAFEGLTLIPELSQETPTYAAILEFSMQEDDRTTRVPFIVFTLDEGRGVIDVKHTYYFDLDKPEDFPGGNQKNEVGATEVLSIDAQNYLVLQRSYTPENKPSNRLRLYQAIIDAQSTKLQKELVRDFTSFEYMQGKYIDFQNFEAMTWGPELDGYRTLIIANDNGSDPPKHHPENTLFLFFKTNILAK